MSDDKPSESNLAELVSTFREAYAAARAEDAQARKALDVAVAALQRKSGLTFVRGKPRSEWVDSGRLDDDGAVVFDGDGSLRTRLTYDVAVDAAELAESDPALAAILLEHRASSTSTDPYLTSFHVHLDLMMRRTGSGAWVMRVGERGEDIACDVAGFDEDFTNAAMAVMKKQLTDVAGVPIRPSRPRSA